MHTEHDYVREYRPLLVKRQTNQKGGWREFKPWLYPPTDVSYALGDAIAWVAAAVAIRLSIDLLISISAAFWLPGVVALTIPAVVAVGLSTIMPPLSLVLGYRLLLVVVGLLLGGML